MTTTPNPAATKESMAEFLILSLSKEQKITIRKTAVNAFFPAASSGTVIEYTSQSAIVEETFDEVFALMGVSTPWQEQS
ncbi:MAG: hypothetical protein VKO39_03440 [Cyanobacteriota bacterium]|nr:hypothetical protein [Cyanobacteriota bacterium]